MEYIRCFETLKRSRSNHSMDFPGTSINKACAEEDVTYCLYVNSSVLPMVLKGAIEMDLLGIISKTVQVLSFCLVK